MMTFDQWLNALAEMPAIPHNAETKILEVLHENFPSTLDNDDNDEVE